MNKKNKSHKKRKSKKNSGNNSEDLTSDVCNNYSTVQDEYPGSHYNSQFSGNDIIPPDCVTFHVDIIQQKNPAAQTSQDSTTIKYSTATSTRKHRSSTGSTMTSESASSSKSISTSQQTFNPDLPFMSVVGSQPPISCDVNGTSNPDINSKPTGSTSLTPPSSDESSISTMDTIPSLSYTSPDSAEASASASSSSSSSASSSSTGDENYVPAPSPLRIAALRGDPQLVQSLLSTGSDPNERCLEDGRSVLHCAAANGLYSVTKTLLSAGAAANIRDDDGRTPLHCASANGHIKVVAALIEAGAVIDARSKPLLADANSGSDSCDVGLDFSFLNEQQRNQLENLRQQWKKKLKAVQLSRR